MRSQPGWEWLCAPHYRMWWIQSTIIVYSEGKQQRAFPSCLMSQCTAFTFKNVHLCRKSGHCLFLIIKSHSSWKIIALVKLSITNVNHYIAKLLFKASGVDVYGRDAPQKGPCAVFVSSFYLQTQEGKEGETEKVYSFSNKETNYKGLSNCLGNSQRIFVETFCSKILFFFLPFSKSTRWLCVSRFKGQNCRIFVCS